MFRIQSNANTVLLGLMNRISGADRGLQANLSEAVHDGLALIAHRVQQEGKRADGRHMETKARKRVGSYSAYYAGKRSGAGRQIDNVDLTNTGKLFGAWGLIDSSPRQASGGFLSDDEAGIAAYLEDYYGAIFELSDAEQAVVVGGIETRIHNQLT